MKQKYHIVYDPKTKLAYDVYNILADIAVKLYSFKFCKVVRQQI